MQRTLAVEGARLERRLGAVELVAVVEPRSVSSKMLPETSRLNSGEPLAGLYSEDGRSDATDVSSFNKEMSRVYLATCNLRCFCRALRRCDGSQLASSRTSSTRMRTC